MEQCLRIALGMVFLLVCLQAAPININDLVLGLVRTEVTCDSNVTFSTPTNVQPQCNAAALKTIKDELERAKKQCNNTDRILMTLGALDEYKDVTGPTTSPDCQWDNKEFGPFVDSIESFVQRLNSASS